MTAPAPVDSCWLCNDLPPDKRCGGFGCWAASMPRLSREELEGLARPRLCVVCESRPALIGKGKNECEKCDPRAKDKYMREPTEREEAEQDMEDERCFAADHSWASDNGGVCGPPRHYDPPHGQDDGWDDWRHR